jgi:TetR/AcrR family transcriptional regulator, transcriptional repressor for nem operon
VVIERLRAAQDAGEIGRSVDIEDAARFVAMTMLGLQVAARAGESIQALRKTACFAVAGLKDRQVDGEAAAHDRHRRASLAFP